MKEKEDYIMWFDLFKFSFDETIVWAFEIMIKASITIIALEIVVNKVCDYVERKWGGKRIKIVLFNRFEKVIEL